MLGSGGWASHALSVPCPCCFAESCFRKYTPISAPRPISTILHAGSALEVGACVPLQTSRGLTAHHRCPGNATRLRYWPRDREAHSYLTRIWGSRNSHKSRGHCLWGDSQQVSQPFAGADKHTRQALGYARVFPRTQGWWGSHYAEFVACRLFRGPAFRRKMFGFQADDPSTSSAFS